MGLSASISGFGNVGHDLGGFSGAKPDRELWLRWLTAGLAWPRFTIHSWNSDATVNEPWMYEDDVDLVSTFLCFVFFKNLNIFSL